MCARRANRAPLVQSALAEPGVNEPEVAGNLTEEPREGLVVAIGETDAVYDLLL